VTTTNTLGKFCHCCGRGTTYSKKPQKNRAFSVVFVKASGGSRTRNPALRIGLTPSINAGEMGDSANRSPDGCPSESNVDAWLAELAADLREQLTVEQSRVLFELLTVAE
jgi:hypothetical protein